MQEHPAQVRPRQLVPPAFVGALSAGLLLAPISTRVRRATAAGTGAYAAANVIAAAWVSRGRGRSLVLLPPVFATLHFAYGVGVLAGMVRFRAGWSRSSLETIVRSLIGRARH
jgi:hypothetical protein